MTTESFPTAHCDNCSRDALATRELTDDELIWVCLHCQQPFETEEVRWCTAAEIDHLGYVIEGRRDPHAERGCRDGGCGVRQPGD